MGKLDKLEDQVGGTWEGGRCVGGMEGVGGEGEEEVGGGGDEGNWSGKEGQRMRGSESVGKDGMRRRRRRKKGVTFIRFTH